MKFSDVGPGGLKSYDLQGFGVFRVLRLQDGL